MSVQNKSHPLKSILSATLFLSLLLLPLTLRGQLPSEFKDFEEVSLESFTDMVIVTASKHEQRLSEAPAYVTVITSEMIEDYGFETVAEALQVVPGMYVNYDRSSYQLGVRGIALQEDWNSRVQLLLNGHLLNEQCFGTSTVGELVGLNLDDIDRIEVVRGPGSSLYGSCAFFATINIITKRPQAPGALNVEGRYTPHTKEKRTGVSFAKAFDSGLEVFLSTSVHDVNGARLFFPEYSSFELSMFMPDEEGFNQYYLTPEDFTGGFTSGTDFLRAWHLFGQMSWQEWSLQGRLANREKGIPTGFYGSLFNDKKNRTREYYDFLELTYDRDFGNNVVLITRLHYDSYSWIAHMSYNYYSFSPEAPYRPGPVWGDFRTDNFWGGEVRLDWQLTRWERLTTGVVYQSHHIYQSSGELDSTYTSVEWERVPEESRSVDFALYDLYLQNELELTNSLTFIAAGNYSRRDHSRHFFAPKAALIFAHEQFGVLKGICGQAFRAPSTYEQSFELDLDGGSLQVGNPGLVHEQVNTAEVVYERFLIPGFRISVSGFEGVAKNLIGVPENFPEDVTDPNAALLYQYQNLDEIEFRGLEVGLERQRPGSFSGFLNLALQSVRDKLTGQRPPNSPRLLANFGLSAPLWRHKLRGSVLGRYVDERKAYDGQVAKSYSTSDLCLHLKNMVPGLSVHAGVKNLFDADIIDPIFEDYYPVVLLKHEGRRLVLNINYSLGI